MQTPTASITAKRAVADTEGLCRAAPAGAIAHGWQGLPRSSIRVTRGQLSLSFGAKDRHVPWSDCRASEGQDCTPVTAAILSERTVSVRTLCSTASKWIELSPAALVLLVRSAPALRHVLFADHVKRLPPFFERISTKNAVSVQQRIADWLLRHACDREVRPTYSNLTADVLTVPDVVFRKLKEFASKGWSCQQRGQIVIEAPAALSPVSKGVYSMCRSAQGRH